MSRFTSAQLGAMIAAAVIGLPMAGCFGLMLVGSMMNDTNRTTSISADSTSTRSSGPTKEISRTCGPLNANSAESLRRLASVCDKGVSESGLIDSADAYGSVLTFHVNRGTATAMRADPLTAKQLVLTWMKVWRLSAGPGERAVSISVKWMDVTIAKGETHAFSDDTVTIQ